jgi:hypothetical protein
VAHAGDNLGAIVFDLHAPAAAIALLAAPKFVIYGVERDRHSGGKSGEDGHQALAMRLPGGFKSKHLPRIFMLTESRAPRGGAGRASLAVAGGWWLVAGGCAFLCGIVPDCARVALWRGYKFDQTKPI